ncbi:MAG: hypothetical protein IJ391_01395 [Clostridia bacterium]|nr:hypothetical protein [Clostridia bacterium]
MTQKLYYTDSKMSSFDATVLSCESENDRYAVVLDKTAFFPDEGGQYADTGMLGNAHVLDVREKNGIITHFTDMPLEVGSRVHGGIDFEDRFEKMQCHSGEHIVSGLILRHYGLNNVGFHLGRDDVTLDFDGVLSSEQLEEIERLANKAVYDNIEITCEFPEPNRLAALDYRSKLELTENVRIVTIGDIDVCACCAPHVSRTGEIGIIKLLDFIHYKGGIRVHMLCGARALRDYGARYKRNREISNLISVKQTDVSAGVSRLLDENGRLKGELTDTKKAIVQRHIAALEQTDASIIVFEKLAGVDMMREFANAAARFTDSFCAVFCEKSENEYNFILAAREGAPVTARDIAARLKERFGARGGGSDTMVSGGISASETDIREFLPEI